LRSNAVFRAPYSASQIASIGEQRGARRKRLRRDLEISPDVLFRTCARDPVYDRQRRDWSGGILILLVFLCDATIEHQYTSSCTIIYESDDGCERGVAQSWLMVARKRVVATRPCSAGWREPAPALLSAFSGL